jgi:hypothetical protein
MVVSPRRAVGGRLSVGDGELRFAPHALDRAFAAVDRHIALDEITGVSVAPRRFSHRNAGGLRRRLCVETADGPVSFVVNHVDRVAADLRVRIGVTENGGPS